MARRKTIVKRLNVIQNFAQATWRYVTRPDGSSVLPFKFARSSREKGS
jgi:hypothetical protein